MATENKKLLTRKTLIIGAIIFVIFITLLIVLTSTFQQDTYPGEGEYDKRVVEEEFSAGKEKEEYRYTLSSGEEVTIQIPKNIAPPSVEVVEELRKNQEK